MRTTGHDFLHSCLHLEERREGDEQHDGQLCTLAAVVHACPHSHSMGRVWPSITHFLGLHLSASTSAIRVSFPSDMLDAVWQRE